MHGLLSRLHNIDANHTVYGFPVGFTFEIIDFENSACCQCLMKPNCAACSWLEERIMAQLGKAGPAAEQTCEMSTN